MKVWFPDDNLIARDWDQTFATFHNPRFEQIWSKTQSGMRF